METVVFCQILGILGITPVLGEELERDEGQPCIKKLGFDHRSAKEPKTPPAERALRIAPMRKEPPAAREQVPCAQCKNPGG